MLHQHANVIISYFVYANITNIQNGFSKQRFVNASSFGKGVTTNLLLKLDQTLLCWPAKLANYLCK